LAVQEINNNNNKGANSVIGQYRTAVTAAAEYAEFTKMRPAINALKRGRPLVGI